MNESQLIDKLWAAFGWTAGIIVLIVGAIATWFGAGQRRTDRRVDSLERCSITAAKFDRAIAELKHEREKMHEQNRETLQEMKQESERHLTKIEQKMDDNEQRSANTRHIINNRVQILMQEVAVLNSRLGLAGQRRGREDDAT